jgi:hypothetical protein
VFSSGANSFTPANWLALIAFLGPAPVYYWTLGTTDPSQQTTYATWQPFTVAPIFNGVGGGALQPPSNGQFQLQIAAPNQSQITVQVSDDLINWTDAQTLNVINGQASFSDPNAGLHAKRFYRSKP